jgi:putative endonuclease
MKRYYVYMLRCFDGSFYVGVTSNPEYRIAQHDFGIDRCCYTYNRRPLKLAYIAEFSEVIDAIAWEKRLKGWSHRKKRALADNDWEAVHRFSRRRGK